MKIYAHRGASAHFPEHTRVAYMAAIDHGADGLECDVRLTKDNLPILWHDADMKRIAGHSSRIAELNFMEIKRIYGDVLLLDDFLEIARDAKKDIAIETKHPVPTSGQIEKVVMSKIAEEKLSIDVAIMSFSWLAIERVKRWDKNQRSVALFEPYNSKVMRRFTSASALGPSIQMLQKNPRIVQDSRDIFVWTVNDADDMHFCANNNVDVLITDTPSHARKVLGYH